MFWQFLVPQSQFSLVVGNAIGLETRQIVLFIQMVLPAMGIAPFIRQQGVQDIR